MTGGRDPARIESLLEIGRYAEARALVAALLAEAPNDPELLCFAVDAALGLGDDDGAVALGRRAVEAGPDDPDCHRALCLAHLAVRSDGPAIRAARECVRLAPTSADAHSLLAYATLGIPFFRRESRRAAARAVQLDPTEARNHMIAGMVAQDGVRRKKAREHYRRALALEPTDVESRTMLTSLEHPRNLARTARGYTEILKGEPDAQLPRHQIGRLAVRFARRLYWYALAAFLVTMLIAVTVDVGTGSSQFLRSCGLVLLGIAAAYALLLWLRTPRQVRAYLPLHLRQDYFLGLSLGVTALMLLAVAVVSLVPGGSDAARWIFRVALVLNGFYFVLAVRRGRLG